MRQDHPSAGQHRVLCVDDDIYLTDLLRYALGRDGFSVEIAGTGAEALRGVQADPPDVVLLDLGLPDLDGLALCDRLCRGMRLPVILLTANRLEAGMVAGFEHGADDYVAKPFSMQVLSYRIRAVLRRRAAARDAGPSRATYQLGHGTFEAEQHQVVAGGRCARLTATQGKILRVLLENEGHVVSAEQLMTKVWPFEAESEVSVVKTHISNLRKKLASALGGEDPIRTVTGLGYMLRPPPGHSAP